MIWSQNKNISKADAGILDDLNIQTPEISLSESTLINRTDKHALVKKNTISKDVNNHHSSN